MRWLKLLLAINGIILVFYAASNTIAPTSYFLPADVPGYAIDVTRVLAVGYLALGLVQLGTWFVTDSDAVRLVAFGSLVFVAGFAILAVTNAKGSSDPFHEFGLAVGAANGVVAVLYALLLYREWSAPA